MLTLILGGARSGKSDLAVTLASSSGRGVLFIATMEAGDDEMRARIRAHQAQRPVEWRTVEESRDLVRALRSEARPGDFVLIDCLTLWVSSLLMEELGDETEVDDPSLLSSVPAIVVRRVDELAEWAAAFPGDVVVVSNEVGLGVVPPHALGRAFRDALGAANRLIAARADRVYYLVAGLVLDVKALGAFPLERFDRTPPHDPHIRQ